MNGNGNKNALNMNLFGEFLPNSKKNATNTTHNANLLGLEENRREIILKEDQPLIGSSRWNPTAEQLLALEEMYRRGTRTPTADQIQHIATQLRRFGKIEGKNVFYWFQNHKARERQKRRREAESSFQFPKHHPPPHTFHNKDTGFRPVCELEQERTLPVSSLNCSQNFEGHCSMQSAATTERTITNGWLQLEEKILQHRRSTEKNYTWHAMDIHPNTPIKFSNNMNTKTSSRFSKFENQNPIKPSDDETNLEEVEVETLELFPLCSSEESKNIKDTKVTITAINAKSNQNQYFEFLPLKN